METSSGISYEIFYNLISRYLLENCLVDKIELDEKHLVVHEKLTDMIFEFTLSVTHLEVKNG